MRTCDAVIQTQRWPRLAAIHNRGPSLLALTWFLLALASAAVIAAVVIAFSAWLAALGANPVITAGVWATAFVFFGLAVDNRGPSALFQSLSGLALVALAVLQQEVSAEFVVVAGVLVAGWAAFAAFRKMHRQ